MPPGLGSVNFSENSTVLAYILIQNNPCQRLVREYQVLIYIQTETLTSTKN